MHTAINAAGIAFVFVMLAIMIMATILDVRWSHQAHILNRPIGDRIELPRDLYRDRQPEYTNGNADHYDRYRGATS